MSMYLSFGGNNEDTIDTSVVSEDPSSVRVKLKNETLSFDDEGANFRVGVVGMTGDADELAKTPLLSFDARSPSASSSLESGVGMPIRWAVGEGSFPTEFLRDEGRLLLRISSGNAISLTIFRVQMSALSSDSPTHVKSASSTVTSVSSEDAEVPREQGRGSGLVGDSNSVTFGEWCLELVRERVMTVPAPVEWRSRSKTDRVSTSGDVGVVMGEDDMHRLSEDG